MSLLPWNRDEQACLNSSMNKDKKTTTLPFERTEDEKEQEKIVGFSCDHSVQRTSH